MSRWQPTAAGTVGRYLAVGEWRWGACGGGPVRRGGRAMFPHPAACIAVSTGPIHRPHLRSVTPCPRTAAVVGQVVADVGKARCALQHRGRVGAAQAGRVAHLCRVKCVAHSPCGAPQPGEVLQEWRIPRRLRSRQQVDLKLLLRPDSRRGNVNLRLVGAGVGAMGWVPAGLTVCQAHNAATGSLRQVRVKWRRLRQC